MKKDLDKAEEIAKILQAGERGEVKDMLPARSEKGITFAVVMDNLTLKIYLTWVFIRATSPQDLKTFIYSEMKKGRK